MNKYNADGKCIKCGGEEIKDKHLEARNQAYADVLNRRVFMGNPYQPYPERISRVCKNCGFVWEEAPLDDIEESNFDVMKAEMDKDPGGIKATCEMAKAAESDNFIAMKDEIAAEQSKLGKVEIRVGDTVKSNGSCGDCDYHCDVAAENGPWYCLKRGDCLCCTLKTNVTLISRGPVVHEYPNVVIESGIITPVVRLDSASWPFVGKRGTLTFKEDIPS